MPPRIKLASIYVGRGPSLPRTLRRNATEAERQLWRRLRNRQLGAKFRRQQPLGRYVLDFYCHEHALVIEVDGAHHYQDQQAEADRDRTAWLEAVGLRVLRFTNREVMTELDRVLEQVSLALDDETREPSLQPSPQGRGSA